MRLRFETQQLVMPLVGKTLLPVFALIIVLIGFQSTTVAQQWPVGQVPVENPVPQYRPGGVAPSLSSPPAAGLPVDFFSQDSMSEPVKVSKPVVQQPVVSAQDSSVMNVGPKVAKPQAAPPVLKVEKKPLPKQLETKKSAAGKKAAKKKDKAQPVLNNEIYRDQSVYPIDSRKPNWPCGNGNCGHKGCQCGSCLAFGNQGRPYREGELGGCECDSRKPNKHPNFSVHWPRPFSAKLDARYPDAANKRYADVSAKRIVDVFDGLSTFKLSKYKRTDNGYYGTGSDPYGCVGESKLR